MNVINSNNLEHDGRAKTAAQFAASCPGIAAGHDAFHAGVAELVDALDLGSSDESCGGSSPSARTKRSILKRLHDEYGRACFPGWGSGSAEPPAQAATVARRLKLTMSGHQARRNGRRLTPCRSPKPSPRD